MPRLARPLNKTITVAASTMGEMDVPVDRYIKRLAMVFKIGFTTPSSAVEVSQGGVLNLIKKIRLVGDGNKVIHDISGKDLYDLNMLDYGKVIDQTDVAGTPASAGLTGFADATAYNATIVLFLDCFKKSPLYNVELGTHLNSRKYQELKLQVTFGPATDVFTTAMGAAFSGSVSAIVEERNDPLGDTALMRTSAREFSIPGTQNNYEILLEREYNTYIDMLYFRPSHTATITDVHADSLINNLRIVENSNIPVFDYDEYNHMMDWMEFGTPGIGNFGITGASYASEAAKSRAAALAGLNYSYVSKASTNLAGPNPRALRFNTTGRIKDWYSTSPDKRVTVDEKLSKLAVLIDTNVSGFTSPIIRMVQRTVVANPQQLANFAAVANIA